MKNESLNQRARLHFEKRTISKLDSAATKAANGRLTDTGESDDTHTITYTSWLRD